MPVFTNSVLKTENQSVISDWTRFRLAFDWGAERLAATPVFLAFDEKPKFQFPRIPQRRTVTLHGRVFVIDVRHVGDVRYQIAARIDGNDRVIGDARIIFRPPNAVKLSDLWIDEDLRLNGLGRYLIELSGELFPNIEWVDTEISKPFYARLMQRGIIRCTKPGRHFFSQSRYAMAGTEIDVKSTKRRRA